MRCCIMQTLDEAFGDLLSLIPEHEQKTNKFLALMSFEIRLNRKRLNLTQKQLAKNLGISVSSLSKWENGEHNFTVSELCKINHLLFTKNELYKIWGYTCLKN